MKVVIPVAGMGTRLQPHTFSTPKSLMHVAGKPILGHILDSIKGVAAEEVIFVTGPMGNKIRSYVKAHYNLKTKFIDQKEPLGLGHAISCAAPFFGPSAVLIVLGDTILDFDIKKFVNSETSVLGVKYVESGARQFGIAFTAKNGVVKKLVEKPDLESGLAVVGLYFVRDGRLLAATLATMVKNGEKTTAEYQLTDALQRMIDKGHIFSTAEIQGWFDCGGMKALLATNRYLLPRNSNAQTPRRVLNSNIVVPPVNIHESCEIDQSIIGPFVTIAEGAKINRCQIADSIIESNASVSQCVLENSIIGANAVLKGKKINLNLGDSSIVELG
ncbi:MAG TPA: sugar phosphate nucleotidyltransferase [Chitinivibrionales bacterium]|nr:sugar phosphate nucleotidyltransferase [Chitinivibrionales bacterium]